MLTVWGAGYSVYSRILRLGLLEKGVAFDWVEVDVFDDPEARAAQARRHPFSKIPSMEHDGFAIYETGACLRYLEQPCFGEVRLVPADQRVRARADQVAGIVDAYGYRAMVWDVYVAAGKGADVAGGLARAGTVLGAVEALAGPVLDGEAVTLADLYLAPCLAYFVTVEAGREMLGRHPAVAEWWERWRDRPTMVRTRYPAEDGDE